MQIPHPALRATFSREKDARLRFANLQPRRTYALDQIFHFRHPDTWALSLLPAPGFAIPPRRRVPDRARLRALMVEQRAGDLFYGGTPEGRPQQPEGQRCAGPGLP